MTKDTTKELARAIECYNHIVVAHPDTPEASYSRTQILNIANRVLSKDTLLETLMGRALVELGHPPQADGASTVVRDEAL